MAYSQTSIDITDTNNANTPRVARAVAQQAVQWWMELQSKNTSAARLAAWQRWRAADPEHETAWQRVEAVSGQLAHIPMPLASAALAAGPASRQRRRTVQLLTALVVVGGSAALVRQSAPWQAATADVVSAVGEIRSVQLPDGSTMVLNTASAINMQFDSGRRLLQLVRGEILVQTAQDAMRRPFLVQTQAGTVRAIGTRFTVRQREGAVDVGVLQGAVELRPADAPTAVRLLQAGEAGSFSRTQATAAALMGAGEGAWADGMLVVSHMRLDDFLAELSRYRRGRLGCDPAIAHLQVSGVYPLADTDRILASLTSALPVDVHTYTRYWVTLRPRPQRG